MANTDPVVPATTEQPVAAPAAAADDAATRLTALEKELKEARSEAAKYRTTLRSQEQAQADAEKAQLQEQGKYKDLLEKEQAARLALEAQVTAATHKQQQLDAAIAAGLPPSMAHRLVGSTAEELAADATALAAIVKPGAPAMSATNPAAQRGATPPAPFDPKNPPTLHSIEWKT